MEYKMEQEMWKFAVIPSFEDATFNRVLEKFYNMGVNGLVRENIQNSLDAKLSVLNEPVKVDIETGKISREDIPGVNEIFERIKCLKGYNSQTRETINHMKKYTDTEDIYYMSFEDSNTKGLTGAENGQSNSNQDTWGIYAYNKGVHAEEEDEEREKARGGSHGIGKISSNAASDIHMMYFANCDAEGNQHLGGTVQLIEHKYNDIYYRSSGYFTDIERIDQFNTKFYPYENKFHRVFEKNTRGLKIIIPFLREHFNNEKEIIKSVCDSFFVSILQGNLEVKVNKYTINIKTIKDYILDKHYYEQDFSQIRKEFTPIYLKTYLQEDPVPIEINSINDKYNFNLYFQYDENISSGRVAIIRTIGMKIEDKRITNNVTKPFNAVMIPRSLREDHFLKSLENESHTELSHGHIKDQQLFKDARRFINNISREVAKIIEEEMKKINPPDGPMDTGDIIYMVENQFRKDLENNLSTVRINTRNKEKVITKINTGDRRRGEGGSDGKKDKNKKPKKRRSRPGQGEGEKKVRYSTHNEMVDRIVLKDYEIVRIDLSNSKEIVDFGTCDIGMSVIDGRGLEYTNEFNISDNYLSIVDRSNNNSLSVENNIIKDINIYDKQIDLKFDLNENYNKSLKFIYYIEV